MNKTSYISEIMNMASNSPFDDAKLDNSLKDDVEFIHSSSPCKKSKITDSKSKNDKVVLDEQGDKAELEYSELLLLKVKDLKKENEDLKYTLQLLRSDYNDSENKCEEQKKDINILHTIVKLQDMQRSHIQEIHEIDLKKLELFKKLQFTKKEYVP